MTEDVHSVKELIASRRVASKLREFSREAVITFAELIDGFLLIALAH